MDLEVVDALRAAGVPDDKARAVVASLHREIDQRYVLHAAQLATRADLMETAARLEGRLGEMATRADLAELRTATRADLNEAFARLEAKIAETRVDLMRWFFGSFLAMGGVLIAVLRLTAH